MMSQTEELRAELDRRKIKWWEDAWDSSHRTIFDGANGVRYCAYEFFEILYLKTELPVTVEQAISATMGAGTCHMKLLENMHTSAYQDMYECDECGEQVLRETYMGKSEPPKFCPNCGRRIKEEAE